MSLNTAALMNNHIRSLTDWLVLSGVSIEIGNQPASYKIVMPDVLQASEPAAPALVRDASFQTAPAAKALGSALKPVQATLQIDKFNSLDELNNFCKDWKGMGLTKTASRAVLGHGKTLHPALMIICDIPDDSEDRLGDAFSSPANRMVRQALSYAGFAEDQLYFTYLSKWRTPAKRALTAGERDVCAQILAQEVGFVAPSLILTLGESTIRGLVPDFAQNIGRSFAKNEYINQYLNKKLPLYASQKGEFLIKNALMKKNFWLCLLELAASLRT